MNNTYKYFIFLLIFSIAGCTGSDGSLNTSGQKADPVLVDFPIAYIKRPIPVEETPGGPVPVSSDLREPVSFNPGAAVYIKDRATISASEINITDQAFAADSLYDVKDLSVSYDGTKLLFAMRAPEIEGVDDDEQPTWNIWEYDLTTKLLRRIITSDISAEAGQDLSPQYLPSGKIVFSSTRQRLAKAILLDEGKPQFSALDEDRNVEALSLHVMNDDGSEMTQITFNQSHDMTPTVMASGKVVFSRWDNAPGHNEINLYQVNPDGSGLEIVYGMHSHEYTNPQADTTTTVEFVSPRQMQDGRILSFIKQGVSATLGGELVYIDWENYIDINQSTVASGGTGPGQVSATPFAVNVSDEPSMGGRFASVYPLYDGSERLLISWSPCRLNTLDENNEPVVDVNNEPVVVACTEELLAAEAVDEAELLYGLWVHDATTNTQLPFLVGEAGIVAHEMIAMAPRDLPVVIPDIKESADSDLLTENVGVVHIRSVYDIDGEDSTASGIAALADPAQTSADNRPARFLRIVKAVSMADRDIIDVPGTAFGRSRAQSMRDILGYATVEPDGSAMFKVPANVAFYISILDENGRRTGERHQNWMSVKAGEVKQCNGCHTSDSELPHGRQAAQALSINNGAPVTGSPFPNTRPALFADEGETMAEVYSRLNGFSDLSVNITYDDVWTDPAVRQPDVSFDYSYTDLTTPSPTTSGCITQWNGLCRITINYVDSIQPLWDLSRLQLDGIGNFIQDNTCVSCHSRTDNMGQTRVPEAQLELVATDSIDEPDHLTSYRELFFNDNVVELNGGAIIDVLVPATDANGNPVYEVDENGNLILDAQGNPIPVMRTIPVRPVMNVSSANNSTDFFQLFEMGGTHYGWLKPAELKLISEWLDIGGQYYNNPFDVPQ